MIQFTAIIKKFSDKGEKTGWTYIEVPASIAEKLMPGNKRSFRVKGNLDNYSFEGLALIPMGEGNFILALNASVRKIIKKQKGDKLMVKMNADTNPVLLNAELMECLADEPGSLSFFNQLTPGHRKYFSNWIDSAKTEATKIKRIAQTINALAKHQEYGQMIRSIANDKQEFSH